MIEIRCLEAEDKEFWYSLDKHLPETEFDDKVRTKRAYVMLLERKSIGLLRYNLFWDNIPFCTMLFVKERYQGMGYGRCLLEYWEKDMTKHGYKILLTSTRSDETSQHFYRKLGYKDCGGLVINIADKKQPMEIFLFKQI